MIKLDLRKLICMYNVGSLEIVILLGVKYIISDIVFIWIFLPVVGNRLPVFK